MKQACRVLCLGLICGCFTLQMTVVEAYVGNQKKNPPDDPSQLQSEAGLLLCEGIAQNTTGNVFVPKVALSFAFVLCFC